MKILMSHNYYRHPGGEDSVFHREQEMLRSAGHEVVEYTRHNNEIVDSILPNVRVGIRTSWAWDSEHQLRAILQAEKPQVAHFHNTFPLISPAAYYACREARVPVVQSLHNARFICPGATFYREGKVCQDCLGKVVPWPGIVHGCYHDSPLHTATVAGMLTLHRLLGTWQQAVDAYIVFTEFFRRKFIAAGLPSEKIFLKPHFLACDPGLRQQGGDYVLYIGRLAPEKGIPTLLEAWSLLGDHIPLRIVGDGPSRAAFEAIKQERHLSDVYFHRWIAPEHLYPIMKRAAFLVFPSEYQEPFGIAIIEAFACGVPVITSRLDTMMELVDDRKTGLHFNSGDPKDLAAKVLWAWSNPGEMETMGRAARAEYQAKYTARRNYQLLLEIYTRAGSTTAFKAAPA